MHIPEEFQLHAWVDESMRQKRISTPMYLLGAVIADPNSCDGPRTELRKILPRGAPKLHWHAMDSREKRRATALVTALDATHLVVVGAPLNHRRQERARAQCMEQLYWRLGELGVSRVILEAREKSQRLKDLQLVNALRSKGTMPPDLRVEIGFPREEPMLWIPDQMLGALGEAESGERTWFDQYGGTIERINILL